MAAGKIAGNPVQIPYDQLKPDTLRALVEEFITREGTDYGEEEASLEKKIQEVFDQLKAGKAAIVFDPSTESCNIVPVKELKDFR